MDGTIHIMVDTTCPTKHITTMVGTIIGCGITVGTTIGGGITTAGTEETSTILTVHHIMEIHTTILTEMDFSKAIQHQASIIQLQEPTQAVHIRKNTDLESLHLLAEVAHTLQV